MDIALMSANANQLRNVITLETPYCTFLCGMLVVSLTLQLIATVILVIERMTCRKHDYNLCHRFNTAIAVMTILIIVMNVFIAAFGAPTTTDPSTIHPKPNNNTLELE